jgi:TP901 family phage tail tape measure protein
MNERELQLILRLRKRAEDLRSLKEYKTALKALESQVRNIQQLGKLSQEPIYFQNVKSLKVYQKELRKTYAELINLVKPKVQYRAGGITEKMAASLAAVREELDKIKYQDVGLKDHINQLVKLEERYQALRGEIETTSTTLIGLTREEKRHGAFASKEANKLVKDYNKVREEMVAMAKVFGASFGGTGQLRPETWIANFEKAFQKLSPITERAKDAFRTLEEQQAISVKEMVTNSKQFVNQTLSDFQRLNALQGTPVLYEKMVAETQRLGEAWLLLRSKLQVGGEAFRKSSQFIKELNSLEQQAISITEKYSGIQNNLANSILRSTQATRESIPALERLDVIYRQTDLALKELIREDNILASANEKLNGSQNILVQRSTSLRNIIELLTREYIKLQKIETINGRLVIQSGEAFWKKQLRLKQLTEQLSFYEQQLKQVNRQQQKLSREGLEDTRSAFRLQAAGFADMIASQAAWMAGFMLIFGVTERVKEAFKSVAEVQQAVTRAMRTARSEVSSTSEIWKEYEKAIVSARIATGASFEDLGEILYQLGSAGLSAEESVAALNSTLSNIIGTEAEVRDITKLIAGLYNNFKDQIVIVDGAITSLSSTSKEWNNSLITSASLTEKFTYINDLLVKAFKDNQVEMMEMRDGLKFMIQSGRAANLTLGEMVGTLAFLNNRLIKAGTAGRAMRVILSKITKDAGAFARAFDIEIDISKPIDFFNILRQINEQFVTGEMSAEKLGIIFKRLGLRGAEAFNVMIQNVNDLEATIGRLNNGLEGSAEAMKDIRLSDLNSQIAIAYANIEALLRKGLVPFVKAFGLFIGLFNKASQAISELNNTLGGAGGWIVTMVGVAASTLGFSIILTKTGAILGWVGGVIGRLITLVVGLGSAEAAATAQTITFGKAAAYLGRIWKSIVFVAVIEGLILFYNWLTEAKHSAESYARELENTRKAHEGIVSILETNLGVLQDENSTLSQINSSYSKLQIALNLNNSQIKNMTENKKLLIAATKEELRLQKEQLAIINFDEMIARTEEIKETFQNWRKEIGKMSRDVAFSTIFTNDSKDMLAYQKIVQITSEKIEEAYDRLIEARNREVYTAEASKERQKQIDFWERAIIGLQNYKDKYDKLVDSKRKDLTTSDRLTLINDKLNKSLQETQEVLSPEKIKKARDIYDGFYNKVINLIDKMKDKLSQLREANDKIVNDKLNNFFNSQKNIIKGLNTEINYLTSSLGRMSSETQRHDSTIISLNKALDNTKVAVKKTNEAWIKDSKNAEIRKKLYSEYKIALEEQIIAQNRLDRALVERNKEVGKGIRNVKEMKEITEQFTQSEENAGLAVKKIEEELKLLARGTDEYKNKQRELVISRYNLSLAQQRLNEQETLQRRNLLLVRNILSDIEFKNMKILNSYRAQIEVGQKYINDKLKETSAEKATTSEKQRQIEILDKVVGKLNEEKSLVNEMKKAEIERVNVLQENGQITALQAENDRKSIEITYRGMTSEISKRIDEVANKQEKLGQEIREKNVNEIDEILKQIKLVERGWIEITKSIKEQYPIEPKIDFDRPSEVFKNQWEDLLSKMENKFKDFAKEIKSEISSLMSNLTNLESSIARSNNVSGANAKLYAGGVIKRAYGGVIPARVSAGEGYVPPGQTKGNLNLLNTLNGGRAVSHIPGGIGQFNGTGGTDNIHTSLPVGSYILSKRGMQAYYESEAMGAKKFQSGGEVTNEDLMLETTGSEVPNIGTFTIRLDSGGTVRSYPVQGDISVLQRLKRDLEKERLTKLD